MVGAKEGALEMKESRNGEGPRSVVRGLRARSGYSAFNPVETGARVQGSSEARTAGLAVSMEERAEEGRRDVELGVRRVRVSRVTGDDIGEATEVGRSVGSRRPRGVLYMGCLALCLAKRRQRQRAEGERDEEGDIRNVYCLSNKNKKVPPK